MALLYAWAIGAFGFTLFTWLVVARLARRLAGAPLPTEWPALTILRPLCGDEPALRENLASSTRYPGAVEIVLLVSDEQDGAHAVAQELAATDARVSVMLTHAGDATNHKVAQLERGWQHVRTRAQTLVTIDSDVQLDDDSLPALVRALHGHGAAFAPPVELEVFSPGDRAAVGLLTASHHDFLALAALADATGGVISLAGALAAYDAAALQSVGGFAPFANVLGEDFAIANALRAQGKTVGVSSNFARSPDRDRTFRAVADRTARWLMVVKKQRGALLLVYPFLLAPTPLLALAAVVLHDRALWFFVGTLALLRVLFAHALRRIHGVPVSLPSAAALTFSAELLMLGCVPRALASDLVWWRGRCLRVKKGGVVEVVT